MSAIADSLRRQRLPLLTIVVVTIAAVVAWALVSRTTAEHLTRPGFPVAAPEIEQARWEIDYSAEGRFGKLSKFQRDRYAAQKVKSAALVTGIYDGIFLEPQRVEDLIKVSFSGEAAQRLNAKKLGFPPGATEVTTTRRRAHIALDAATADFAIGRIRVVAEATIGNKTEKVDHRSTLWLERSDNGWKVIAFDLEQGPAK